MEQNQSYEAVLQLVKSFQKANQTIVDSALAIQERNMQLAQSLYTDWLEALKDHTQNNRALMQEMEQLAQKQQDTFQKLARESVANYLDLLGVALSSPAPQIRLSEKLQFCLLALASRYPNHIVNINEEILGPQSLGAEGWRASDLIELFLSTAPEMLQAKACLEVTAQQKGIYLLERSEEIPAFWVYCGEVGEKTPPYRGNMATRQGVNDPVGELQTAVQ